MTDPTHLLLVPHTHWDREWYQTFQQFRMRLVRTVDKALDALETDPDFSYFTLDGQTIVLEDYLDVRPENAGRLRALAQQGRLLVGPWYLQPDEYLVGGESLIRNLQLGQRMAAPYGGAMSVGYVPDTFGHISQLPQILRGFGIDNAVFWRGVGPEVERGAFRWAAPDGSDVLVIWLYDQFGYSNAAVLPLDATALTARLTTIAERMGPRAVTDTLLLMNGSDHQEPQTGLPAVLAEVAPRLREHGLDLRIGTLPQYVAHLRAANLSLPTLSGEMRSGHTAHLLPGVLSTRMWLKQRNAAGEALLTRWAEPATAWAALYGAPYPAALLALAWKFLLHNHPHDSICGCGIDEVHAEMLPRFAQSEQIAEELTTQALTHLAAHADTCGEPRAVPVVVFNPAPGPRTEVVRCEARVLFSHLEVVDPDGNRIPHQVHASNGTELLNQQADKQLAIAMMGMLSDGRALGYAILDGHLSLGETPGVLRLDLVVAENGDPDVARADAIKARILELAQRDDITTVHVVAREAPKTELLLLARDLPSYGGRVFFLRPVTDALLHAASASAQPYDVAPGEEMRIGSHSLENAHLRVTIDPTDGTFTLHDKHTDVAYPGLNAMEDSGDVGDLYNYSPPARNPLITVPAWPPSVELVEPGPARATLRVQRTYLLPAACAPDRQSRAGEQVTCLVTSDISLTPAARRIEIRTTVENTARDHRLRVLFPMPFVAEYADAEDAFAVTRRPAQAPGSAPGEWDASVSFEQPVNTQPQKRFVDVSDGTQGLAVLNRGLPEYEVLPARNGAGSAVALTLLRCVEWLSRDDLSTRRGHAGPPLRTPEAQGLGTHVFAYALVPHAGDWRSEDALALQEAQAFEASPRAVVTLQHPGPLGNCWSFVQATPAHAVVSAIKRADSGSSDAESADSPANRDTLLVRVYNPLETPITAEVVLALPFSEGEVVALDEQRILAEETSRLARILNTGVQSQLRAGAIQTLRFRIAPAGPK